MLVLNDHEYTVYDEHYRVRLLPKEYELLKFLLRHHNRVFLREELLDAVWKLEEPVARTVDDHIYRLRKKLAFFSNTVALQTVRGRGYRLLLAESERHKMDGVSPSNPLLDDPDYRFHVQQMFNSYVIHGSGQGIKVITGNPEVFDISSDAKLNFRTRYYSGDFSSVVMNDTLPWSQRLFWLLKLYENIQFNHASSLRFFRKALDNYRLSTEDHLEATTFDLPLLYLYNGEQNRALTSMADSIVTCTTMSLDGYIPLARIRDAMFSVWVGDLPAAESKMQIAQDILQRVGWQRETGYLDVVRGFFMWATHQNSDHAENLIDSGLNQLKDIGFVHYYIWRVHEIIHFFTHVCPNEILHSKYQRLWRSLSQTYEFPWLELRLREQLSTVLD